MKGLFAINLAAVVFLSSCSQGPIRTTYSPELPQLPAAWETILGKPHWRLEWVDENGSWKVWEGKEGIPELSLMHEWTSAALCWPFWPEKGLVPGLMYPGGALFPWDVSEGRLVLSWKAGVDALFWRELAQNEEAQKAPGTPRLPWLFDWPRFRELMETDDIPLEIRENPWLADWSSIAGKTVESGFDRRRIKAAARTEIAIPCPGNLWTGSSPFVEPISVIPGEPLILLVRESPETWISASGLLRCQKGAWIFIPWN
jgi:hypothetical protein